MDGCRDVQGSLPRFEDVDDDGAGEVERNKLSIEGDSNECGATEGLAVALLRPNGRWAAVAGGGCAMGGFAMRIIGLAAL